MKTKNYFIGTNQEAAEAIIAHYMTSGQEDKFMATIPQKRIPAILEEVKKKSDYVYKNIIEIMENEKREVKN